MPPPHVLVVGAGAWGSSAALALVERGFQVTLVDANLGLDASARLSSSDDISKILRGDYGPDTLYSSLFELAMARWRALEAQWGDDSLFHWTGVGFVSERNDPSSYEQTSYVHQRGAELLGSASAIRTRLLGLNRGVGQYEWGYFNPAGGWAESTRVLTRLHRDCARAGVSTIAAHARALIMEGNRVLGATLDDGSRVLANITVAACGAWTPFVVPATRALLRPVAMPVFHFSSSAPGPDCPVTLDIARSGFYLFPSQRGDLVKIGHHGQGWPLDAPATKPSLARLAQELRPEQEARFRRFAAVFLPHLAQAPAVDFRLCQYCDSLDGDFLVDWVPLVKGLAVAAGGSGHGFKFASVMGHLVADLIGGVRNPNPVMRAAAERFQWRRRERRTEAARAKV